MNQTEQKVGKSEREWMIREANLNLAFGKKMQVVLFLGITEAKNFPDS
jgi:hypothetical protein